MAPIRRFPRKAEPFDYRIPDHLTVAVGTFVMIPFKDQVIEGLVTDLMPKSRFTRVRELHSVSERQALPSSGVIFYKDLARHTYQSIGSVLHASIPPLLKRASFKVSAGPHARAMSLDADQVPKVQALIAGLRESGLLRASVPSDAFSLACAAVLARAWPSLLVLCPDVHLMYRVAEVVAGVRKDVVVYGDTMNKTEALHAYDAIRSGSGVVVATRIGALVCPTPDTPILVIASGEDELQQVDQNPHYDARWCAQKWHELQNNPLMMLDVFPRVEDGDITHDMWETKGVEVVDMASATKVADPYMISAKVRERLASGDRASGPFLVYYNRKGDARVVSCAACGGLVTCSSCSRPSSVRNDALWCAPCNKERPIPDVCPSCRAPELTRKGLGNAAIADMLRRCTDEPVQIVESGDPLPDGGIAVVTRVALHLLDPVRPKIRAMVLLQADHEFVHRGFRSMEQAGRLLRRLASLARTAQVPCLIQTWSPDTVNRLLGSTHAWHEQEKLVRTFAGYPPAKDIVLVLAKKRESCLEAYISESPKIRHSSLWLAQKVDPGETIEAFATWPQSCDICPNPGTFPLV